MSPNAPTTDAWLGLALTLAIAGGTIAMIGYAAFVGFICGMVVTLCTAAVLGAGDSALDD